MLQQDIGNNRLESIKWIVMNDGELEDFDGVTAVGKEMFKILQSGMIKEDKAIINRR